MEHASRITCSAKPFCGNQPMAMQATAVDLLMHKGEFEPQVAQAIAEALAVTMTETQVVTVPVLDARLAVLDHKVDGVESRLEKKIDLVGVNLENKIDLVKMDLENKIDLFKMELENKIQSLKMEIESKIQSVKIELESKMESMKMELENKIESVKMDVESVKMELGNKSDLAVARLEKAIEVTSATTKAELVRWVFVAMVGSVFLQGVAAAIVNALMRH
jgi:hypothetical protein